MMTRKEVSASYDITTMQLWRRFQSIPELKNHAYKRLAPKQLKIIFEEFGIPPNEIPKKYRFLLPKDQK